MQHHRETSYYQSISCCVRVHVSWLCKLRGKNQDNVTWTTCWALWSDQNSIVKNHLDFVEVQYQLNIMSLRPALFSDDDIESGDNRNLCINLVINNTKIIEHYKNNILLFKEAMRINKVNSKYRFKSIQGIAIILWCFKVPCINFM